MEIESKTTNGVNLTSDQQAPQISEDLFNPEIPTEIIHKTVTAKLFTIKDTDGSDDTSANFFTANCDFHITTKRFMVSLKGTSVTQEQNLSLWCEYYNCLSHGTSGNKMILLIGNAVLNEKMENGYEPEDVECESQIESIKKEFVA